MSNGRKIVSKIVNNPYIFSVISKVISIILVMAYSIIYSRYMKPELKGFGDIIRNYAELLMIVICFGINQAYPFLKKKSPHGVYFEHINLSSGLFLLYVSLALVIILIFRPAIKIIMILLLLPMMFVAHQFNYAVLIENPKRRNISTIVQDAIDIVIVGILYTISRVSSYQICLVYLFARQVVHTIISLINLKINPLKIRPSLKKAPEYIKYGIVPMFTIIMMEINYKADIVLLHGFKISDAEIGVYSLGITLASKLWLIPDAIKDILLSRLTNIKDDSTSEVKKVTRLSLFVVVVMCLIIVSVGKPMINLLYGQDYKDAYLVICVLLLGIIGMVFYKMIYSVNLVNGHRKANLVLLTLAAAVNIVMDIIFIPVNGILGAGIASTISYFCCGIGFLVYFCKVYHVNFYEMIFLRKEDIKQVAAILNAGEKSENKKRERKDRIGK